MARAKSTAILAILVSLVPAALAGCANDSSTGGDPGAMAMPAGQSCQSVRGELNKLDAHGIREKFDALNRGQKLSPQAQADVNHYNDLLNLYLGARCHV